MECNGCLFGCFLGELTGRFDHIRIGTTMAQKKLNKGFQNFFLLIICFLFKFVSTKHVSNPDDPSTGSSLHVSS